MRRYDLYMVRGDSHYVVGWRVFEADDVDTAIEVAGDWVAEAPIELWKDGQMVKRWTNPEVAASP